ncbi:PREDICTED: jacalin-related lectin 14-like [Camelina sativa]|uniref:Jacalin-related lectin 14-like n=1 Tax=Camelina sativa TaxID=90675 RepID=A0ABM0TRE9_CAMSA|nr:PREDICTED: jacalin-related lectin 14-like [Camelina sativa]
MAEMMEAIGRPGGNKWDDGSDHDGVSKIYVRVGSEGIQTIHLEYVKSGQLKRGKLFGVWDRGFTHTIEIDSLNNEYLESVEGYYDDKSNVIQALQFKTNTKTSELLGYNNKGKKFSLLQTRERKSLGFMDMLRRTSFLLEHISPLFLLVNQSCTVVLVAVTGMMVSFTDTARLNGKAGASSYSAASKS